MFNPTESDFIDPRSGRQNPRESTAGLHLARGATESRQGGRPSASGGFAQTVVIHHTRRPATSSSQPTPRRHEDTHRSRLMVRSWQFLDSAAPSLMTCSSENTVHCPQSLSVDRGQHGEGCSHAHAGLLRMSTLPSAPMPQCPCLHLLRKISFCYLSVVTEHACLELVAPRSGKRVRAADREEARRCRCRGPPPVPPAADVAVAQPAAPRAPERHGWRAEPMLR
jgi:hypothetical protein